MKRIMTFLLSALVLLSLAGCGGTSEHSVVYEQAKYVGVEINEETVDCVGVFTQYTNDSSESACAADWIDCKTYQNGVELSPIVPADDKTEGYIQCDAYVQSGNTASVVWLFTLEDKSPVTVEIAGEEYTVEMTEE